MGKLNELRALGFDESKHIPFTKSYLAKCSGCMVLVINGTPCHEKGCSNKKYECKGCNTLLTYHGYCEDCR